MKDVVAELNHEVCPTHHKHPHCRMTSEGIDIDACCADFRKELLLKLRELNHKGTTAVNDKGGVAGGR